MISNINSCFNHFTPILHASCNNFKILDRNYVVFLGIMNRKDSDLSRFSPKTITNSVSWHRFCKSMTAMKSLMQTQYSKFRSYLFPRNMYKEEHKGSLVFFCRKDLFLINFISFDNNPVQFHTPLSLCPSGCRAASGVEFEKSEIH